MERHEGGDHDGYHGTWTHTNPEELQWNQEDTLGDDRDWHNDDIDNAGHWHTNIQPEDSVSNAGWSPSALTPPPLDTSASPTMHAAQWLPNAQYTQSSSTQPADAMGKNWHIEDMRAAQGMHAMLGAIAQQRQAQLKDIESNLQQLPQRIQEQIQSIPSSLHRHRRHSSIASENKAPVASTWAQSHDHAAWITGGNVNGSGSQQHLDAKASSGGPGWGSAWDSTRGNDTKEQTSGDVWSPGERSAWDTDWDATTNAENVRQEKGTKKRTKKSEKHGTDDNSGWANTGADFSSGSGWGNRNSTWETTVDQALQHDTSQSWGEMTQESKEVAKKPKFFTRLFSRFFKKGNKKEKEKKHRVQFKEDKKTKSKTLKKQKSAEQQGNSWAAGNGWSNDTNWGESNEPIEQQNTNGWEAGNDEKTKDIGINGGWGTTEAPAWRDVQPNHSRTFSLASEAQNSLSKRTRSDVSLDYRFVDSRGHALSLASHALYNPERLARNRIIWYFDPNKDRRVAALLGWIQKVQYALAAFGLQKFLETGERGALFANADYRVQTATRPEPAFDWLTYGEVQQTMDKTLQESLKFYEPTTQIIVFVFLLSKSKNSMAIWRRKLPLSSKIRQKYAQEMNQIMMRLKKDYQVFVDENIEYRTTEEPTNKRWLAWGR